MTTKMLQMERSKAIWADCHRVSRCLDRVGRKGWREWRVEVIDGIIDFIVSKNRPRFLPGDVGFCIAVLFAKHVSDTVFINIRRMAERDGLVRRLPDSLARQSSEQTPPDGGI